MKWTGAVGGGAGLANLLLPSGKQGYSLFKGRLEIAQYSLPQGAVSVSYRLAVLRSKDDVGEVDRSSRRRSWTHKPPSSVSMGR